MTPDQIAAKSAEAMLDKDKATHFLGFTFSDVAEGRASASFTVQDHHCNGHGSCHGGIIFALADSAFGVACNSRNQATVAQHNTISFVSPGRLGDTLTATAVEVSLTGRSGIYDVSVSNQDGVCVAEMRGCSRSIKGQLFDESDAS